jgi:hypothetical protein
MARNPEENLTAVRTLIARRILQSDLAKHIGFEGDEARLSDLEEAVAGSRRPSYVSWLVTATFRRAGTDCTLDVGMDWSGAKVDDLEQVRLEFGVNHPTHGSSAPSDVLARTKLYQDVAMLAAEIEAEVRSRFIKVWTKAL